MARKAQTDKKEADSTMDEALFKTAEGEPLSVEESFREIELRISALDNEELPLEEAFERYREGMALIRYTSAAIDEVEHRVQEISDDGSRRDFE